MHNIKDIRKNLESFKKDISNRYVDFDSSNFLKLDEENRKLIQEKEKLENEKKTISKSKDKKLFAKSKEISKKIDDISKNQNNFKKKIDEILSSLPNIALEDVPIGKDETFNKEIKKSGSLPNFKFKPKSHFELGENLEMLDFDLATKTSGSRFVFVKGQLAHLERAISNFMIDIHTQKNQYKEISPPLIASSNSMYGTGQLPKFENDQFEINLDSDDRKFLIPTAEVILDHLIF